MSPGQTWHAPLRIETDDTAEFAARVCGWRADFSRLRPDEFIATADMYAIGPLLLATGGFTSSLAGRLVSPSGRFSWLMPDVTDGPFFFAARPLGRGQCLALGPDVEFSAVHQGKAQFATVSVAPDSLTSDGDPEVPRASARVLMPQREHLVALTKAVSWIMAAARSEPAVSSRADIRASMIEQMIDRVRALLHSNVDTRTASRAARVQRRRGVLRAQRYVDEHWSQPIRLAQLCAAARVQSRALEHGFREVLGMTPIVYVRTVRLNHVRRRLLSPEWKSRTISRIALDCGFWHLSQFAADYRRMFGETPSATRAARSREISLDAGLDGGDRNLLSRAGMAGAIP